MVPRRIQEIREPGNSGTVIGDNAIMSKYTEDKKHMDEIADKLSER